MALTRTTMGIFVRAEAASELSGCFWGERLVGGCLRSGWRGGSGQGAIYKATEAAIMHRRVVTAEQWLLLRLRRASFRRNQMYATMSLQFYIG